LAHQNKYVERSSKMIMLQKVLTTNMSVQLVII